MKKKHWFLSALSPAKYKVVNDELWIKQASHDWELLKEHIHREHPELKGAGERLER